MIPQSLSAMWSTVASALGNHLWQSTLFAVAAGLLTLVLRKNQARARYWLWLAASLKFLVPFSLLTNLGSRLAWWRGTAGSDAGLYFVIEQVSQPFTQKTISQSAPQVFFANLTNLLPALLTVTWICGSTVVLLVWVARWRRVSAAVKNAVPLREGREVEALRRLEKAGGLRRRIEIFLSRASLEPGILGIARPVLVWPEGISDRLEDAHLEAIVAHEVWHVRRNDNLAAAVHMVVEAIFWFHPLVWWLGARMVDERERACDEEVLQLGSPPQVYAESILKICEFCVGSPLACVAGVTGSDLKKRIANIMNKNIVRKLNFGKKLLLSAAGVAAIALPIVFGLAKPAQSQSQSQAVRAAITPGYESVLITPNLTGEAMPPFKITGKPVLGFMFKPRFLATNATLHQLTRMVYGVQDDQVAGGPSWFDSEHYDVEVKMDQSLVDELQKLSQDQQIIEQKRMLQGLLADRFRLSLHRETRDLPVCVLAIAQNGPRFHEAKPDDTYANGAKRQDGQPIGPGAWGLENGQLIGQGVSIASLVAMLSNKLGGRIVVDKTGLTGTYDLSLSDTPSNDTSAASISAAIEEQLGLRLEPQTIPLPVLVVDRAEKPTAN
jgi:bla regulator protein BlaR1